MKPIRTALCIGSVVLAMVVSQAAMADNRHKRRGYSDWGYNSNFGHNNRYYRSVRYNSYHYGRSNRRDNYVSFSFGNHYSRHSRRHRHFDGGEFVGGLILGSLLTYPRREEVIYRAPVTTRREVVVVRETPRRSAPVVTGRRLLKDLDGNCFERQVDEQGNEIRIELDPSECNF